MNVGFIGLGSMGAPMARNLIKAGHKVTVYNRTQERAEALAADGAVVARKASETCSGDVLISMLADDKAIENVFFGDENLIQRVAPNTIHLCMSTISVSMAKKLVKEHSNAGRGYLSAPVFGRPDAAAAAKLFVVVSGSASLINTCQGIFDAVGQRTFNFGEDPVAANVVKLAGNFLITCVVESLGESFALLRKSGVDHVQFLDFITSTLFNAPVYKTYGGLIAREQFTPPGFKVTLGLKDIRLVLAAADEAAVPMPVADIVHDHFLTALARGWKDLDWSSVGKISADNAGL